MTFSYSRFLSPAGHERVEYPSYKRSLEDPKTWERRFLDNTIVLQIHKRHLDKLFKTSRGTKLLPSHRVASPIFRTGSVESCGELLSSMYVCMYVCMYVSAQRSAALGCEQKISWFLQHNHLGKLQLIVFCLAP